MRAESAVKISCSLGLAIVSCAGLLLALQTPSLAEDNVPRRQVPWTTSKMKGSPEPPLPYKTSRVFRGVTLDRPTDIAWLRLADKWIATQHGGKYVTFPNDPDHAAPTPVLDLSETRNKKVANAYGILFHPDQDRNPYCFITFLNTPKHLQGNSLGRLRVIDPTIPSFDLESMEILFSWSSMGHSGGSMQFGRDGMLYLTIGDGQPPYPPDADETGQDLSDLESSILRIDVNHPTSKRLYRIPPDNPFVGRPNVRGEIWAYGFRNPWKLALDPSTGDLLVADVGWEMREMIHRVGRGRNHGWSIMEGSQPIKQDQKPVTPITPPLFEHTHVDSRSISGGHYWQSDRIPELKGAYIYGDWMTGKVWALKHNGDNVIWQKELVDTPLRVISFMLDPAGEVLIVGYDGSIHRLDPNTESVNAASFPTRLSETGIFSDVAAQSLNTGVVEYQISAPHWADGTHSRQWIALPGSTQVALFDKDDWKTGQTVGTFDFPQDTVLAKTVSYYATADDPTSERHLETQLLHKKDDDWRAYNYIWNEQQNDAILQADVATERKLSINDPSAPNGIRTQTWRHSSRSECLLCHIWAAGTAHAFWPPQLNIELGNENQLESMTRLGLFAQPIPGPDPPASPYDANQPLEDRARSYLALNCSTCHRRQGGGSANFNFEYTKTLAVNNYINLVPAQGTFGIDDARVLAPGDPLRSVMLYRALKSGRGHMPQFGSNVIDMKGVQLLHDWIQSLEPTRAPSTALKLKIAELQQTKTPEHLIQTMLGTTSGAMALSLACNSPTVSGELRDKIVQAGCKQNEAQIRDLFEHYLPEEKRVKRLGATVNPDELLAITGSVERGEQLFQKAKEVNCRACHQIGDIGKTVGPNLSGIGSQQTPAELLASIIDPSAKIAPQFRARNVLTIDGKLLSGIVIKENEQGISLVDADGRTQFVAVDDIEDIQPAKKSAMPDQLLSGMPPQQAADLIAYLSAQRKIGPRQHKQTTVRRAKKPIVIDGTCDEAEWGSVDSVGDFEFTWWNEGEPAKQPTDVRMLWDDDHLYLCFQCTDTDVQAIRTERDSDVYRDDCVEVFASPDFLHPERYFNIEMNALATQLDQYRSDGKKDPTGWNPDGIRVSARVDGTINDASDVDGGWCLEVAIPFRLFSKLMPDGRPKVGDQWRMNLNRLEQNMSVKSQWSQGDRNFPRFHHPEYFGFLKFAH